MLNYKNHPFYLEIAACKTLDELKKLMEQDKFLEIAKNAINCVFSDGNQNCELLVIGEAPGENEDETGIPFCGRSGKYLDKFLNEQGFFRKTNTYVTNVVNWRPEGNRKPTDDEIAHCLPYLEKHIQLLDPKLIATFGSTSAFAILSRARFDSTSFRIGPLIAKTYQYKNFFSRKEYSIFVMYHPSYMMRKRNDEGQFREQFAVLKRRFNELSK